jgi:hypothetical protein
LVYLLYNSRLSHDIDNRINQHHQSQRIREENEAKPNSVNVFYPSGIGNGETHRHCEQEPERTKEEEHIGMNLHAKLFIARRTAYDLKYILMKPFCEKSGRVIPAFNN